VEHFSPHFSHLPFLRVGTATHACRQHPGTGGCAGASTSPPPAFPCRPVRSHRCRRSLMVLLLCLHHRRRILRPILCWSNAGTTGTRSTSTSSSNDVATASSTGQRRQWPWRTPAAAVPRSDGLQCFSFSLSLLLRQACRLSRGRRWRGRGSFAGAASPLQ
jgi:hypothetical protein